MHIFRFFFLLFFSPPHVSVLGINDNHYTACSTPSFTCRTTQHPVPTISFTPFTCYLPYFHRTVRGGRKGGEKRNEGRTQESDNSIPQFGQSLSPTTQRQNHMPKLARNNHQRWDARESSVDALVTVCGSLFFFSPSLLGFTPTLFIYDSLAPINLTRANEEIQTDEKKGIGKKEVHIQKSLFNWCVWDSRLSLMQAMKGCRLVDFMILKNGKL